MERRIDSMICSLVYSFNAVLFERRLPSQCAIYTLNPNPAIHLSISQFVERTYCLCACIKSLHSTSPFAEFIKQSSRFCFVMGHAQHGLTPSGFNGSNIRNGQDWGQYSWQQQLYRFVLMGISSMAHYSIRKASSSLSSMEWPIF
jgi:hypothetical protein